MGLAEDLIEQGGWEWRQGQVTRKGDTLPDIALLTPEYKPGFAYCLAEVFNRVQGDTFIDNRVIARLLATAPEMLSFLEAVIDYHEWMMSLMDAVNAGDRERALDATKEINLNWNDLIKLGRVVHAMATGQNPELLNEAVAEAQQRPGLIVSEQARAKILEFKRRADDAEPELPGGPA